MSLKCTIRGITITNIGDAKILVQDDSSPNYIVISSGRNYNYRIVGDKRIGIFDADRRSIVEIKVESYKMTMDRKSLGGKNSEFLVKFSMEN